MSRPTPYLNQEEKKLALTLAAFIALVEEKSEEWAASNTWPITMITEAETAKTHIEKVLEIMFKDLDRKQLAQIRRNIKSMEVVVKYRLEAIREYKQTLEMDNVTPVETEDLYELVEAALHDCNGCKTEPSSCGLRAIFIKYDVPFYREDAQDCPYRY